MPPYPPVLIAQGAIALGLLLLLAIAVLIGSIVFKAMELPR